ncbi:MAG: helix-turn-helix domain-containing protein [Desulfobacterales bacterium]|nr:helix-turn-helix domain-containing protein [Desulfobacterales bacterium]
MTAANQSAMSLIQQFGISPQEAKAYFALLEKDNVTGYTLSKNAGIHSSKIYGILSRLLERQFIIATDTHPVKYVPRKPDDILSTIKKEFDDSLKALSTDMNRIYNNQAKREFVTWNITKRTDVFRKVRELIDQATDTIFLATWSKELRPIRQPLEKALQRGVKLNTVVYGTTNFKLKTVYQHQPSDYPLREMGLRRFVFAADSNRAAIANFSNDNSGSGLWTDNTGLVMLFRDFIIHEIYIIKIQEALPSQVQQLFGTGWEKIRQFNERTLDAIRP